MSRSECPRSRSLATIRAWLTAAGDQWPSYGAIRPSRAQRLSVLAATPTRWAASWSDSAPGDAPLRAFTAALDIPDTRLLPPTDALVAPRCGSPTRTVAILHSRRRGLDEHEAPPPAGETARCVGRW